MGEFLRIGAALFLITLAGCSTAPMPSQDITIEERTDLDCDDAASEFTLRASVTPYQSSQDLIGVIGFQDNDGDIERLDKFEIAGETSETIKVSYSDLDVDSTTRFYVLVKTNGFLSKNQVGSAETGRVTVESSNDDQPILKPNLIIPEEHPSPGEVVEFTLEKSTNEGCGVESIQWDFDNDGESEGTGPEVEHTFSTEGYHDISVTMETTTGVATTLERTILVTDSPGMKFRDAADPVPRSTFYPQGLLQVLLTIVISVAVVLGIRYRN